MTIKESIQQVKNPLTMIAIFAGLAEIAATTVLPMLNSSAIQSTFVWYVMLFPVFLVVCFFITLNFNHKVLYAPSDFKDERHFFDELRGGFTPETSEIEILRTFWKPNGIVNRLNENRLKQWLKMNGIDPESITFFLRNRTFSEARKKAVVDLEL